ncbi:hypothetical protein ACSBR1_035876 [Camellia fascicularis]
MLHYRNGPSLITKAKEGGINAIETYVFWNAHEPIYRQNEMKIFATLIVDMVRDEGSFPILTHAIFGIVMDSILVVAFLRCGLKIRAAGIRVGDEKPNTELLRILLLRLHVNT